MGDSTSRASEGEAGYHWLKELYDLFAPVREDMDQYAEEEVNQAIQQALAAVRRRALQLSDKAEDMGQ